MGKFSAFYKENPTDAIGTPVIEDVEVQVNPEDDSELIFSYNNQQCKMDFLLKDLGDKASEVVLLDAEGQ